MHFEPKIQILGNFFVKKFEKKFKLENLTFFASLNYRVGKSMHFVTIWQNVAGFSSKKMVKLISCKSNKFYHDNNEAF